MPTVSAACGCSPTARVRRPQRDRNSMIWRTITKMMTDIVIGPELRNIRKIQPTSGRSMSSAGELDRVERAGAAARLDQPIEVAGQAEGDDVDDRAADDLVGPDA